MSPGMESEVPEENGDKNSTIYFIGRPCRKPPTSTKHRGILHNKWPQTQQHNHEQHSKVPLGKLIGSICSKVTYLAISSDTFMCLLY